MSVCVSVFLRITCGWRCTSWTVVAQPRPCRCDHMPPWTRSVNCVPASSGCRSPKNTACSWWWGAPASSLPRTHTLRRSRQNFTAGHKLTPSTLSTAVRPLWGPRRRVSSAPASVSWLTSTERLIFSTAVRCRCDCNGVDPCVWTVTDGIELVRASWRARPAFREVPLLLSDGTCLTCLTGTYRGKKRGKEERDVFSFLKSERWQGAWGAAFCYSEYRADHLAAISLWQLQVNCVFILSFGILLVAVLILTPGGGCFTGSVVQTHLYLHLPFPASRWFCSFRTLLKEEKTHLFQWMWEDVKIVWLPFLMSWINWSEVEQSNKSQVKHAAQRFYFCALGRVFAGKSQRYQWRI